ncbi:hypothetical protein B0I35DRAFT_512951 [Stachybotrys elegans]|uniref:Uncharacterized protein n=1 Tax=Stachybotrys elegans TaxID=80388 RepID=A0A8K0SVN1_9HYPO|nr:hypothetical protein B0I35DRAFT_512951 [Stachybotrys elegans]
MGQRHQLFVIAKVGPYYRSLAAVHHQWLYGFSALRQCCILLGIFSHPKNHGALQQELRSADEFFREKGPPPREPQALDYNHAGPCPFPFITTCLMVGASYAPTEDRVALVHEEPLGLGFDQGDNNDGITILDITDLNNVKYCFVHWTPSLLSESEDPQDEPLLHPLTGRQYATRYYPENHEMYQLWGHIADSLDRWPLINVQNLADAWPWGKWHLTDTSSTHTDSHPQSGPASLMEQTADRIVDAVLSTDDVDALDHVRDTRNIHQLLKQALLKRADTMCSSPASAALLSLAYENDQVLDWGMFSNLDVTTIKAALQTPQLLNVKSLCLPGQLFQSPDELWRTLGGSPKLTELVVLDDPSRQDDQGSTQLCTALLSSEHALPPSLETLTTSGPFSNAIRNRSWLPEAETGASSLFPVVQLLVSHKTNPDGWVNPHEYFFLGDCLLSPVRFINGLLRFIRVLNNRDSLTSQNKGHSLAVCMAAASPSIGDLDIGSIGPFPAEAYTVGRSAYCSSISRNCYTPMRNLVPGQWTVMLARKSTIGLRAFQDEPVDYTFHYAFVRSKVTITSRVPSEDEVPARPEDLDVFDMEGFIKEHGKDPADLQDALGKLKARAYGESVAPERDDILVALGKEEACVLLNDFMRGLSKVRALGVEDF